MTITEFLNARYDEEEAIAREQLARVAFSPRRNGKTIARRRVADIAAKRAIVAAAVETLAVEEVGFPADERGLHEARSLAEFTILTFAQAFTEHADFDPAWRV